MYCIRGLLIVFAIGYFFSFGFAHAQGIQYSIGPSCRGNEVICPNPNESPECIVLEPRVHINYIENTNSEKINRYLPTCPTDDDSQTPGCIDIATNDKATDNNVIVECIEHIKCERNDEGKLIATCTSGREPTCLGNNNTEPDCEQKEICTNSIPACEHRWQAFAGSSNFH